MSDVPAVASGSAMRCKIAPSDSGETESLDCSFRKSEIICERDLTSIAIRKAPVARFMVNRFMSLPQKYGYRLGGEKTHIGTIKSSVKRFMMYINYSNEND